MSGGHPRHFTGNLGKKQSISKQEQTRSLDEKPSLGVFAYEAVAVSAVLTDVDEDPLLPI